MFDYNQELEMSGKSLYFTLYDLIRQDIITAKLPAHTRLPGKRKMAERLGVSINTVMNAYELLLTEGYIYARERSGYFVTELAYKTKERKKFQVPEEDPEMEEDPATDFRANRTSLTLFPASLWERCMREAISGSNPRFLSTVSWKGLYDLRRELAIYLHAYRDMDVDPGNIIIGPGTEYLYYHLLAALGSGTRIGSADLGRSRFENIARPLGIEIQYIPIDKNNMRVDALRESGANVVHNSPANLFPIGRAMPIQRRLEMFQWLHEGPDRWIIEDDYDSEFRYDNGHRTTMFSEDTSGRVIYLNTFSKTMVPSIRISYMVLPDKLMPAYEKTLSFYASPVSSYEQYAMSLFLSKGYFIRHLNRLLTHYRKIRNMVIGALSQDEDLKDLIEIEEYKAGTHFLLHIKTALSEEALMQRGLDQGIRLVFFHGSTDSGADKRIDVHTKVDIGKAYTGEAVSGKDSEGKDSEGKDSENNSNNEKVLIVNYASFEPEQIGSIIKKLKRILL
ncbi:MAG: PLP-dependent aminotransferase family protein [Bilifractor sp.]